MFDRVRESEKEPRVARKIALRAMLLGFLFTAVHDGMTLGLDHLADFYNDVEEDQMPFWYDMLWDAFEINDSYVIPGFYTIGGTAALYSLYASVRNHFLK